MYKSEDFVFCIFSCNRYSFLKNLVASIDLFYPENKIIIYDDNSDEMELTRYYDVLKLKPRYEIIKTDFKADNKNHGGLYALMNLALEHAKQKNYLYAFFMQDDMQFVQHTNLSDLCEKTFVKWNNALMYSPLFMQKIYLPQIDTFIEEKDGDLMFKNYGIADAGIIHLGRAADAGLIFDSKGEKYNGKRYFELGCKLVLSYNPCLAWVPWAMSVKNKKRRGWLVPKKRALFIEPLNEQRIRELHANRNIPFLEDYTSINRKWLPKPYFYLNFNLKKIVVSYFIYWKYLLLKKTGHAKS